MKREPITPTGPRSLSFWDPGWRYPRRLRVKIAKRDRRIQRGRLRLCRRIRLASNTIQEFLTMWAEAEAEINDPERLLRNLS